ncbi:Phosphoserine phosphatase, chloroplastic, partial [Tetrabaena socialis]
MMLNMSLSLAASGVQHPRGNSLARVPPPPTRRPAGALPAALRIGANARAGPFARSVMVAAVANENGNGVKSAYTPKTEPTDRVLSIWRKVDAVCFDVDCTVTINDSLDLLAEFMGVKEEVEALTNKAMDGSISLAQSLEDRLSIINCSPTDVRNFITANPPSSRLTPGIKDLITALKARGVHIYLISGGFRELILPLAAYLGIPKENVFANRMNWQWDDETGEPTKLMGFDLSEPTAHNQGKVEAIAGIRQRNPYNTVVMIGDGITDLEAVQQTGGADLFIGFGGVIERPMVAADAEWFVYDYATLVRTLARYKVAMVGSGAWACAAVRMVAQNTEMDDPADEFVDEVTMWTHEEDYQGRKLTEVINETHENPHYLPGVSLGPNVRAEPNLEAAVKDADLIIFCAPHQFMHGICKQLIGKVGPAG